MRKNWLSRAEANTIRNGVASAWARAFRRRPLVSDDHFQADDEPYPGHGREFPDTWPPADPAQRAVAAAALNDLPETWREVVRNRDVLGRTDAEVADDLGLSIDQERAILTAARAEIQARLDTAIGDEQ
jgi:DNA-directed RNA polymerase specialized sigma24 family protein